MIQNRDETYLRFTHPSVRFLQPSEDKVGVTSAKNAAGDVPSAKGDEDESDLERIVVVRGSGEGDSGGEGDGVLGGEDEA
jgi:hypothetical protein